VIAAIIDLIASRDASTRERREMDGKVRRLLEETYDRFTQDCEAVPTLTQGDSIELLVTTWQPIVFLFHRLLMERLRFRVGLGTGPVEIHKEHADECDGPAFWNAREALEELKGTKYMSREAGFRLSDRTSNTERQTVIISTLILASLLCLTATQLTHCYYHIWEEKSITEIAEIMKTTKGNVSRILGKTPCYILQKVMAFLSPADS